MVDRFTESIARTTLIHSGRLPIHYTLLDPLSISNLSIQRSILYNDFIPRIRLDNLSTRFFFLLILNNNYFNEAENGRKWRWRENEDASERRMVGELRLIANQPCKKEHVDAGTTGTTSVVATTLRRRSSRRAYLDARRRHRAAARYGTPNSY